MACFARYRRVVKSVLNRPKHFKATCKSKQEHCPLSFSTDLSFIANGLPMIETDIRLPCQTLRWAEFVEITFLTLVAHFSKTIKPSLLIPPYKLKGGISRLGLMSLVYLSNVQRQTAQLDIYLCITRRLSKCFAFTYLLITMTKLKKKLSSICVVRNYLHRLA